MESFQALSIQAVEKLKVADHLAGTTYSLVKEPKLLVSVIENIFSAFELSMNALFDHEKNSMHIPEQNSSFESRMDLFRRKIATKYDIGNDVLDFIIGLKKTLDEHKKSSVEFSKKNTLVISDNDYNLTTLNIDDIKKLLSQAKRHLEKLLNILKH